MDSEDFSMSGPMPYVGKCDQHGEFDGKLTVLFGRELKSRCPVCAELQKAGQEKRDKVQESIRRSIELAEKLGSAAIPKRFSDRSFESYRAETDRQKTALQVCQDYAENFKDYFSGGRCLMLMGRPGTGKTHLACAIANHIVRETGGLAVYRTVGGLLIDIKASYSRENGASESMVMSGLCSPELLILDEVGATKPSEFELSTLFAIINKRYEHGYPTMIVSNLPPKKLAEAIGDRCVDRLREGGEIVVGFDWESKRGSGEEGKGND